MHAVAQTLNTIADELNAAYFERRDVIEALVLAVLAKQHAFILGPPGTGKSELARDLLHRFTGSEFFEQLLSKTRPDQAVLGPYNLPLLRDAGQFQRNIDGFLLTSHFAFLDEVGKMSPTMGHDLLAALNERIRHEVSDGNSVHQIPLHTAVTASNELIVGDSEDAAALWDRLLVRCQVDYIVDDGSFARLMGRREDPTDLPTTLDFAQLAMACEKDVPAVTIGPTVMEGVVKLRHALRTEAHLSISDRRWRQSMRVLQARAFLHGRDYVEGDDLEALRFTLWETPEQYRVVERLALKVANPMNEELTKLVDQLAEIRNELAKREGKSDAERAGYGSEALAKIVQVERALGKVAKKYEDARPERFARIAEDAKKTRSEVLVKALNSDPSDFA